MKEILIASGNNHKIEEFKEMLNPLGYDIKSLNDFDFNLEIEENGKTFEENAYIKAKALFDEVQIPVISDDSGFCIEHFDDYPGIYSARFKADESYDVKNQFLIDELKGVDNRNCKYVCVICYIDANGDEKYYRGEVNGIVADKLCGSNGFGYDPIFFIEEKKCSMAELTSEEKNSISHRHKALEKLIEDLKND